MTIRSEKLTEHLMIVPSLACPASCNYCFGPHVGGEIMSIDMIEEIIDWQARSNERLEITFHGGEPLMAGAEFYREALPLLERSLRHRKVRFSIQSNLWLLTEELCQLFLEHRVTIGTSLDGPEDITDAQRGVGYFRRTMEGIELARRNGLDVGCICTFTPQSLQHSREIFDFFLDQGLNFSIHASIPSLQHPNDVQWSLSANEHTKLLSELLDLYSVNLDRIMINTLDSMCKSVFSRRGGSCIFSDCLGKYLAIGPDGNIYPCQRFAGLSRFSMGNVRTVTHDTIRSSPVWRMFQDRQDRVDEECRDCSYLDICRSGCPYHVLAANGGRFEKSLKDPHCSSYKKVYQHITDRALEEVFSQENMDAVITRADERNELLQRGKLISMIRDRPHPYQTARQARRVLASVALASGDSPINVTSKMQMLGVLPQGRSSEKAMIDLYNRLNAPISGLNNLYLHVTFDCNLRCTHCYADAGLAKNDTLSIEEMIRCCRDASRSRFRQVVITGGEPLVHPQRDRLLDALSSIRESIKPLRTVLRTNLTVKADDILLERIASSVDEVVVSVDGDRETHEDRRGQGTYDLMVNNLRRLAAMSWRSDISLTSVLSSKQINGAPGESVRMLARELGIERVRFKPLLPLGRAKEWEFEIEPNIIWNHVDERLLNDNDFTPTSSCGIGQNLYVEPDGHAYPCYAWHGPQWCLGSIIEDGLEAVVASEPFRQLGKLTVNANRHCNRCELRFLCGGACRAWSAHSRISQDNLDHPPAVCSSLYRRARSLLGSALYRLNVTEQDWRAAGFPLPETAPPMTASFP